MLANFGMLSLVIRLLTIDVATTGPILMAVSVNTDRPSRMITR